MTNLDSMLKSRDITLPTKICLVKAMVFPVVMYGYEGWTVKNWAQKNWCFWTVVLEKTLESPLDCKVIKPVHPKGKQFWIFIGRTDAKSKTPILWPPDGKNWLIWKDLDAGISSLSHSVIFLYFFFWLHSVWQTLGPSTSTNDPIAFLFKDE